MIHVQKMREIKKYLMSGLSFIRIGIHTKGRLIKRGYTKKDIISCICNGSITEIQHGYNHQVQKVCPTYVIEGKDAFANPIVVVISEESKREFSVVTVMPPIDKKRFKETI
ncbi:DUF4258 domain-containing protein [Sutcliffiella sp. NPDC057660]|uniref:DUF4258 domain-containing protein n=1 Tax=Sutcliffiella sp. NPDC057660 TaxID=3346199 RepID=UPI0036931064